MADDKDAIVEESKQILFNYLKTLSKMSEGVSDTATLYEVANAMESVSRGIAMLDRRW